MSLKTATPQPAPLRFHPLLPATQAAMDAMLEFDRYKSPFSGEDQARSAELRLAYLAAKAVDPGGLLNDAEELERWAATKEADAESYPGATSHYLDSARIFRRAAADIRAQADEIVAPLAKAA